MLSFSALRNSPGAVSGRAETFVSLKPPAIRHRSFRSGRRSVPQYFPDREAGIFSDPKDYSSVRSVEFRKPLIGIASQNPLGF
jgi:hypothetical protein